MTLIMIGVLSNYEQEYLKGLTAGITYYPQQNYPMVTTNLTL